MKDERKEVIEHDGECQVCGQKGKYAILGKGDTLYPGIGRAICICKICLDQDAEMDWDKMETA
jgi:hypothetical protein